MGSAGNGPIAGSDPVAIVVSSRLDGPAAYVREETPDELVATSPAVTPSPTAPGPEETRAPTFEEVVARYAAEVYRYAVQLTRNRADADDLYQETLLRAYRAFGRLDGAANHRAWLYRIATNTFLSDRRKNARVDRLDDAIAQTLPAVAFDHAAGLDARALLAEVAAFVENLPPKQRAALTLRKYHELEYVEIAAALGGSEAAARASVHAALRKLRERFGNRPTTGDFSADGTVDFRVIVTTGLALLYLAGCLAALSLLASIWRPSL